MKKILILTVTALATFAIIGCNSNADVETPKPKGDPPNVVEAPPGAKTPEQRGMEEQGRAGGGTEQDGGGQDGT